MPQCIDLGLEVLYRRRRSCAGAITGALAGMGYGMYRRICRHFDEELTGIAATCRDATAAYARAQRDGTEAQSGRSLGHRQEYCRRMCRRRCQRISRLVHGTFR